MDNIIGFQKPDSVAVRFRPRRAEDLAEVAPLLVEAGYPSDLTVEEATSWLAHRKSVAAFLAETDERVVGHVSLAAADADTRRGLWAAALPTPSLMLVVQRLFVAQEHRGQGVGRALLRLAVTEAMTSGCVPVLDVLRRDVAHAVPLYISEGFVQVAVDGDVAALVHRSGLTATRLG